MLGQIKGWFGQSVGHFELTHRLESFCAAMVHGVAFTLSNHMFFSPLARFFKEHKFLSLWFNAGAQSTNGFQVQRPSQKTVNGERANRLHHRGYFVINTPTHIYLSQHYTTCSSPIIFLFGQYRSRVAQWKRAGLITQRPVDQNHALLSSPLLSYSREGLMFSPLIITKSSTS